MATQKFSAFLTTFAIAANLVLLLTRSIAGAASTEDLDRLIQLTSLDNILRITAEQAGFISDRYSEELPSELRTELRHAVDSSVDYNKMSAAVSAAVASNLDRAERDRQLQWWASASGREVAKAEASIYAGLFASASFDAYNPASSTADPANAARVSDVIHLAQITQFMRELLEIAGPGLACLRSAQNAKEDHDCLDQRQPAPEQSAQIGYLISQQAIKRYMRIPAADLDAYLEYLRTPERMLGLEKLRAAFLTVDKDTWRQAVQQTQAAVDRYARKRFHDIDNSALRTICEDIDNARDLEHARFTLALMQRGAPPNPAVLLQLARVTLKLAPDQTSYDVPPSLIVIAAADAKRAERYIDQAMALGSVSADVYVLAGHIAYLQRQFQKSVDFLQAAQTLGGSNPWLHVNLGDAYFALGMTPLGLKKNLGEKAIEQFETALRSALPAAAEGRAVHQLGSLYAELGNASQADPYYRRYIEMQDGRNKAYAQLRYAHFLLFAARDEDAALRAAREAEQTYNFPLAQEFVVQMLTVKGGTLVASGRPKEAQSFLDEARRLESDIESMCPDLARLPALFPGVVGIHASGALRSFAGRIGGQTLVHATLYATPAQIEQLLSWGADPNYLDPDDGTPLHAAILSNNVEAVRTLLAHGANAQTPFVDGRLPCELALGDDPKRTLIRAVVLKAAGGRCNRDPMFPFKVGYKYRLKKDLDGIINGQTWAGDPYLSGELLVYKNECRYTDPTVACLIFDRLSLQGRPSQLAILRSEFANWQNVFQELGPAR